MGRLMLAGQSNVWFPETLAEVTDMAVRFGCTAVQVSRPNAPLAEDPLNPDRSFDPETGGMYAKLKAELEVGDVRAVLWMQGETDATDIRTAVDYFSNLVDLIEHVRRDTNSRNLPVVIGRIADVYPHSAQVREAQMQVGGSIPNTTWVDMDDIPRGNGTDKLVGPEVYSGSHFLHRIAEIHYDILEGRAQVGRRLASVWATQWG